MAESQQNGTNNNNNNNNTASEQVSICRKYIWGRCYKYTWCKFRHELVFEEMIKNLKFCHDFQNKISCTRENCSYLHSTREEEAHFKATGTMPRALAERHAAMAARDPMGTVNQGLVMNVASMAPPPPPAVTGTSMSPSKSPPMPLAAAPPLPSSAPPLPPPTYPMGPVPQPSISVASSMSLMPPTVVTNSTPLAPPVSTTTALLPPLAATCSAMPPPMTPITKPTFPAPAYAPAAFALPPSRPPIFDASRPPPTHTPVVPEATGVKRKAFSQLEAGASNAKKSAGQSTSMCEECVLRKQRIDSYQKNIEASIREEADKSLRYNNLLQPYNRKMALALSLVRPDKKKALEDYIEHGTSSGASANLINQNVLLQLVEMLVASSSRNFSAANNNTEEAAAVVRSLVGGNVGNATQAQQHHHIDSHEEMVRTISGILMDGNRSGATRDFPMNSNNKTFNGNSKLSGIAATRSSQPAIMPAVTPFPAPSSSFPTPSSYFPTAAPSTSHSPFPGSRGPYPGSSGPFPAQAARFPTPTVPFSQSAPYTPPPGSYSAQTASYRPRVPPSYPQANGFQQPSSGGMTFPTPPPTPSTYQFTTTSKTNGSNQKPPVPQYRSYQ